MRIIRIPKGGGKFRVIYVPDEERKAACRKVIATLSSYWFDQLGVAHGFMPGRSPVTNAMQHVGYRYTLSFDLKDFFDSVTPNHIHCLYSDQKKHCFYRGRARQGLPSSPALANIAAIPMDTEIMKLRHGGRFGILFVYTRYADDLTFSFDLPMVEDMLRREVPRIVESFKFQINEAKTKFQRAAAGRRIITGVAVDHKGIHPTREMKRKRRAAENRFTKSHSRYWRYRWHGLAEWCRLVVPKHYKPHQETTTSSSLNVIDASAVGVVQSTQEFARKFNL
jgi:RNA-directed DNA polymerase